MGVRHRELHDRRRAVPPGERADARGSAAAGQLPAVHGGAARSLSHGRTARDTRAAAGPARTCPKPRRATLLVALTDPIDAAGDGRRAARRAARQGRDGGRSARLRLGDAPAGAPTRHCRPGRRRSTSSAPAATRRAASTSRPARRCSRRRCGVPRRQARQPLGLEPLRQRRRARGARPAAAARRAPRRRLPRRHGLHLPVRAALPPGDEGKSRRCAARSACAPCSTCSAR